MNDQFMPCGLDDERIRLDQSEPEDNDQRTEMEKRLGWLCDEWAEAIADDTYDTWRDVRMMIHGASQALIGCRRDDRHEDRMALMALGSLAFEYGITCIHELKYEGAPNVAHV